MDKLRITGGIPLKGTIHIAGAKNAALPLMTAALLSEEPLTLTNVPHLADIITMANLLVNHGVHFNIDGSAATAHAGRVVRLTADTIHNRVAPYDIVRKMRASVLVLGPLLARFGDAKVSLPGGCAIGTRPIDIHLKALEQMGAVINLEEGYVHATVNGRLKGAEIHFSKVSVGATENILMAATLAEGTTVLHNAAREPEVSDLAHCLNAMGAQIDGIGTDHLIIEGQPRLHAATHRIVGDRIEAGTYAAAALITDGDIELVDIDPVIMESTNDKFIEAGAHIENTQRGFRVRRAMDRLKSVDIITQPYPGFATDMQAQMMALMAVADGSAIFRETIFENRYMHVPELTRMGANITVEGNMAVVRGVERLLGAEVMATDLRASVSLVLAALSAEGSTLISRIYHLDRGYECLEEKLAACGAQIERVK